MFLTKINLIIFSIPSERERVLTIESRPSTDVLSMWFTKHLFLFFNSEISELKNSLCVGYLSLFSSKLFNATLYLLFLYFRTSLLKAFKFRSVPFRYGTCRQVEWDSACVTFQAVAWVFWRWPGSGTLFPFLLGHLSQTPCGVGSGRRIDIWRWGYCFIRYTIRPFLRWRSCRWMIRQFLQFERSMTEKDIPMLNLEVQSTAEDEKGVKRFRSSR